MEPLQTMIPRRQRRKTEKVSDVMCHAPHTHVCVVVLVELVPDFLWHVKRPANDPPSPPDPQPAPPPPPPPHPSLVWTTAVVAIIHLMFELAR